MNAAGVKYFWMVTVDHLYSGKGGIFSIKYNESRFREKVNPGGLEKPTNYDAELPSPDILPYFLRL
jgi:hypothetical protein